MSGGGSVEWSEVLQGSADPFFFFLTHTVPRWERCSLQYFIATCETDQNKTLVTFHSQSERIWASQNSELNSLLIALYQTRHHLAFLSLKAPCTCRDFLTEISPTFTFFVMFQLPETYSVLKRSTQHKHQHTVSGSCSYCDKNSLMPATTCERHYYYGTKAKDKEKKKTVQSRMQNVLTT